MFFSCFKITEIFSTDCIKKESLELKSTLPSFLWQIEHPCLESAILYPHIYALLLLQCEIEILAPNLQNRNYSRVLNVQYTSNCLRNDTAQCNKALEKWGKREFSIGNCDTQTMEHLMQLPHQTTIHHLLKAKKWLSNV